MEFIYASLSAVLSIIFALMSMEIWKGVRLKKQRFRQTDYRSEEAMIYVFAILSIVCLIFHGVFLYAGFYG